jgi:hypothetical protein
MLSAIPSARSKRASWSARQPPPRSHSQPRHLDDALEAVDGALEEYRKSKADFHIEKAERLREKIRAAKGKL